MTARYKVIDYPTTAKQAKPMIDDALRYVALGAAARLLFRLWVEKVSSLYQLRWLHLRYTLFFKWRKS